jgi:Flp pilus assembly secretin CpaC
MIIQYKIVLIHVHFIEDKFSIIINFAVINFPGDEQLHIQAVEFSRELISDVGIDLRIAGHSGVIKPKE